MYVRHVTLGDSMHNDSYAKIKFMKCLVILINNSQIRFVYMMKCWRIFHFFTWCPWFPLLISSKMEAQEAKMGND